ncbi:MAG TPA: hypothetical protein PKC30_02395 [Saprospiraceae bacterium]|nr:hypothetical protein [Saprospiraceae bacterium]
MIVFIPDINKNLFIPFPFFAMIMFFWVSFNSFELPAIRMLALQNMKPHGQILEVMMRMACNCPYTQCITHISVEYTLHANTYPDWKFHGPCHMLTSSRPTTRTMLMNEKSGKFFSNNGYYTILF